MHHHKEAFEEICELITNVDSNGEAISQTLQLRTICDKFRLYIADEMALCNLFDMFNGRALIDDAFILSLVTVITSRQLNSFVVSGKNLRQQMLSVLQKNFMNVETFKQENMKCLYNSITLLGEYFNKARLSNGCPIDILGQSLLNLLNVELEKELKVICHLRTDEFAKLILTQIALNGSLLKKRHKTEIEQLFFTMRKCLIEVESLSSKTKAFLIMTLDLYYSNFTNVGDSLEKMYATFLVADNIKFLSGADKVQTSLEKLSIIATPQKNLKIQLRAPEQKRNGFVGGQSSRNRPTSTASLPRSPQKTDSPQKPPQNASQSNKKKISPQELRNKKPQSSRCKSDSPNIKINMKTISNGVSPHDHQQRDTPTTSDHTQQQNGSDENILRQQNSHNFTPPSAKCKPNNKVYFREENVENLSWNNDEASHDRDAEDPDQSTSPEVNPYSTSFLNFLSSN